MEEFYKTFKSVLTGMPIIRFIDNGMNRQTPVLLRNNDYGSQDSDSLGQIYFDKISCNCICHSEHYLMYISLYIVPCHDNHARG